MELYDIARRALPGIDTLVLGEEPLATCARCAMAPRPGALEGQISFPAEARCCTYHPILANWLVGRALGRGDRGSEQVRARLTDPEGIGPLGIEPGPTRSRAWRTREDDAYGRDTSLTCPYWVDEGLGCSIHRDRDAVCRTWFCKVSRGARGAAVWMALKAALAAVELALAEACAETLSFGADPESYYRACAAYVGGLDDEGLASVLPAARLEALMHDVRTALALRDAPLPEVVQPRIRDWVVRTDEVALSSFSPYDRTATPSWIFVFLAQLDGVRTWREAADLAGEELGRPVPPELVLWLWDRGLLGPAVDLHGPDEPVITAIPGD